MVTDEQRTACIAEGAKRRTRPRLGQSGPQTGQHYWVGKGCSEQPPEAKADLEDLAQYILRNPFSVEKMTQESPGDIVINRSKLNAKIKRNYENVLTD